MRTFPIARKMDYWQLRSCTDCSSATRITTWYSIQSDERCQERRKRPRSCTGKHTTLCADDLGVVTNSPNLLGRLVQLGNALVQTRQQLPAILSPYCGPSFQWQSDEQLLSLLAPQLLFLLHSLIQGQVLQAVFDPGPYLHQLMAMNQQLPLIPLLPAGRPQFGKALLQQQGQNVGCISPVCLLFAHIAGADFSRVSHPHPVA